MENFILYHRVSTARQGASGLGLEAQRQMTQTYVASVGGKIVGEFVEVESGKRVRNRPQLKAALAACRDRRNPAVLLVAKLDRLARNAAFVTALLDSPIEFRAADMPQANRLLIQLISVFAEYEAKMISDRTKAALASRRRRGFALGNTAVLLAHPSPSAAQHRQQAVAEAQRMRPIFDAIRSAGATSVRAIAEELNRRGYTRPNGTRWHPTTVARVIERQAA